MRLARRSPSYEHHRRRSSRHDERCVRCTAHVSQQCSSDTSAAQRTPLRPTDLARQVWRCVLQKWEVL